jgi:lysophospholipase L1-like esterase
MKTWQSVFSKVKVGRPRISQIFKPRRIAIVTATAGGLVCAQLAHLQATYIPLKPPVFPATSGYEVWSGQDENRPKKPSQKRAKRVLIIGDSLVVGIGCEEQAVMPHALCKKLSELLEADIVWSSYGINGADIRTIYRDAVHRLEDWVQHQQPQLLRALARMVPDGLAEHHPAAAGLRARLQAAADASAASAAPSSAHGGSDAVLTTRASGRTVSANEAAEDGALLAAAQGVDIVVVMCGLNDFKRLPAGRTAGAFRRDLDRLLELLQDKAGAGCLVALPALPLEETCLPQPLKSAAIWLGARFDAQKRAAAAAAGEDRVQFIPKPAVDMWTAARERAIAAAGAASTAENPRPPVAAGRELLARDGVHPNEAGYVAFAEYLATELAARIRALEIGAAAAAAPLRGGMGRS